MRWCSSTSFLHIFLWSLVGMALLLLAEADEPATYIFGDSTVDVRTNDYVPGRQARADFLFNGIDLPNSLPAGRFSNGLNTADQIVKSLGYKRSPPPYLYLVNHPSIFKREILHGVDFAPGGAGILNTTGQELYTKVISLEEQIQQFAHVCSLYGLGARKFGILAVPPIGCCPYARGLTGNGSCLIAANQLAEIFHDKIDVFLNNSSPLLYPDMEYSLGDIYQMTNYILDDPLAFGFKNFASACCGNASYPCKQTTTLCDDRHDYLFWHRHHPTEVASELAALTLFGG